MTCKTTRMNLIDWIRGDLTAVPKAKLENHLAACAVCREEAETLRLGWEKLQALPPEQPSDTVQAGFDTMLTIFRHGLRFEREERPRDDWLTRLGEWLWPRRFPVRLAFIFTLLIIGLAAGLVLGRKSNRIARMQGEIETMQQNYGISLLEQPSAVDRLQGISMASRVDTPRSDTITALLQTLNTDPDINVRLAAVDALYLFTNLPEVKNGVLHSLSRQTSPLVQAALIDFLVGIRERRAIEALKQLIQKQPLLPEIRNRAEAGVAEIGQRRV